MRLTHHFLRNLIGQRVTAMVQVCVCMTGADPGFFPGGSRVNNGRTEQLKSQLY